jgi:hypothetical protein
MYTRVREDRKRAKGTTPTKIKIPLSKYLFLGQLDPATDIPYSYALSIVPNFIGRNVLISHDDLNVAGYIACANLTSNKEHVLEESNDENSTYNGKPIAYHSIMGYLAIAKKKIDELKKFHAKDVTELDCSIGYTHEMDADEDDIHFDKEGDLDLNKTLVYATNFKERENSLCDRGMGACKGARVLHELVRKPAGGGSKFGFGPRLWTALKKTYRNKVCLSKENNEETVKRKQRFMKIVSDVSKIYHRGRQFRMELKWDSKPYKFENIQDYSQTVSLIKKKEDIQRKLLFTHANMQKGESGTKSDKPVDEMDIDTPNGKVESDKTLKQDPPKSEKELGKQQQQQPETAQPTDTTKQEKELSDNPAFENFLNEIGIIKNEKNLAAIGEAYLKSKCQKFNVYREKAEKDFPANKKRFEEALRKVRGNNTFSLGKDDESSLKSFYSDHSKKKLVSYINELIASFDKVSAQHSKLGSSKGKSGTGNPLKGNQGNVDLGKFYAHDSPARRTDVVYGTFEKKESVKGSYTTNKNAVSGGGGGGGGGGTFKKPQVGVNLTKLKERMNNYSRNGVSLLNLFEKIKSKDLGKELKTDNSPF